jgi:phosphofructokinase-like protein
MRLGILTGGGDCPGLNAVIRAVTKTAINEFGATVIGFLDAFRGLVLNQWRELKMDDVSGILTQGGTILGSSNRDDPANFIEDHIKKTPPHDRTADVLRTYERHKLDGLVTIGGDGTLEGARKFSGMGLNIIHIPKTIDNDVPGTDMTFGFNSAMTTATEAIDKIHTTAASHHRVMIVETMGRNAGWLALSSGIAGGGDVILIPEIPYDIEIVCDLVQKRHARGRRFTIIVIAEGAKPRGGQQIVRKIVESAITKERLGGVGNVFAEQIEQQTGIESRNVLLGYLQRGGTPTPFDRILATNFGTAAAKLAAKNMFQHMVCVRGLQIESIAFDKIPTKSRLVPLDSPLISAARAVGTCLGDA